MEPTTDSSVFTSETPEFKDPRIDPPPKGREVWMIQQGGVLIRGIWSNPKDCLAWYPFPKMPPWLKQRLSESYLNRS